MQSIKLLASENLPWSKVTAIMYGLPFLLQAVLVLSANGHGLYLPPSDKEARYKLRGYSFVSFCVSWTLFVASTMASVISTSHLMLQIFDKQSHVGTLDDNTVQLEMQVESTGLLHHTIFCL